MTIRNSYPNCYVDDPNWIGDGKCHNWEPYNTEACGWDGGDCLDFNEKYPNCTAIVTSWIGDGDCYKLYNTKECGYDGGDCDAENKVLWEKYPNCTTNGVDPSLIGDGYCHGKQYNTEECGWDGGDCIHFNDKYPDCTVDYLHHLSNGECDKYANTEACGWDDGDCIEFNKMYPNCTVDNPVLLGDGNCDDWGGGYNTKECGWDGGDCIISNNIKEKIIEKYPGCYEVDDYTTIGDGKCDPENDFKACGWDDGDCMSAGAKAGIIITSVFVILVAVYLWIKYGYNRDRRHRERIERGIPSRHQMQAGLHRYQQGMNELEHQSGTIVSQSPSSINEE